MAMVSEGMARRLFSGENPLGKHILPGRFQQAKAEDETEIVGIVNDIKFGSVTTPAPDMVFQPLLQGQNNSATTSALKLHVRSRMAAAEVAALVRARIGEMRLPVSVDAAAPLEDAIANSMLNDRIRMQASGVFGVLALLLITAGIYGLMAYSVAMRTREIGIRMVVGSQPSQIVAMVLRQGLRLTAAGVVVGLPGALTVMKAVSGLVFGLSPIDWASVAIAVLVLCVTRILASVAPAWRAAYVDPVEALRVQ
jgi:ABC-type antimicrobial peptide transport system permease subunit